MHDNLNNLKLFIRDFNKVRDLGFQPARRSNSTGIGKTLEDLIGVTENNLSEADLHGFEIKSQRNLSGSYITLFTKAPTMPKNANTYLRQTYGSYDQEYPDVKVLHTSIFHSRFNTHVSGAKFSLEVNRDEEKIYIVIENLYGEIDKNVYYSFENLRRAIGKIKNLAFVSANTQMIDGVENFHFTRAVIFYDFISFEHFLNLIESGLIMYDVRVGAYKTGVKRGKTHDHGSGFRIKKENMCQLYRAYEEI
ncbi:MAG: MvaI/BcnI family restriction endonuclease [Neisseria zoodegmatis]|uniref:MvaI/BcnI family restriction endonuclease n=1 Tax=Neisseria zoodegmatis TaxID=326523 RepID=UPI0026EA4EE9|nr:MvaI/BcnI family restriction endonuclease [Neisseria zoodegmatis]MDO5068887.1 MvaI/BcnI family restriction endonuclease [Neisseria zoodegmatis]